MDQCGGFTYKGFITTDSAQKFRIFFFHFVLNFEDGVDSWNWVTYKSEKEYLRFENKRDPEAEKYGSGKLSMALATSIKLIINRKFRGRLS